MQEEEVSDAVKDENTENIDMGVTANGSANWGVYQANASANLGIGSTRATSAEIAHKNTRQQTERITSELRRNFRTTFSTTVDVQDTSSRRHVIQNTTDKLINYEFRRKMRRVGIQLQRIGTFLCWQAYIDEPGKDLGLSELVHIAKPDDMESNIQPPEAPSILAPKDEIIRIDFPYEMVVNHGEDLEDDYIQGVEETTGLLSPTKIVWEREYDAVPPGQNYKIASVNLTAVERGNPEADSPDVSSNITIIGNNRFKVSLPLVNFGGSASIRLILKLIWNPPEQTAAQEEYKKKLVEYTDARRREAHSQYVNAVRERIKLASSISPRISDDLRKEERTVIFRRLITQLMGAGYDQSSHVKAELIRSLFDVDKMLYYVASDWWMPRPKYRQEMDPPQEKGGRSDSNTITAPDTAKIIIGTSQPKATHIPEDRLEMKSVSTSIPGVEKEAAETLHFMTQEKGQSNGPNKGAESIDEFQCPPGFQRDPFSGRCVAIEKYTELRSEKVSYTSNIASETGGSGIATMTPTTPKLTTGPTGSPAAPVTMTPTTPKLTTGPTGSPAPVTMTPTTPKLTIGTTPPSTVVPTDKTIQLTEGDTVEWGGVGQKDRNNYLITEDSESAPMGASLGWLIQLDGDNHRNAFLNSPWVKAVIPIIPGKEESALEWLKMAQVEGTDGLGEQYIGPEEELQGKTIEEALKQFAERIAAENRDINNVLKTETVFENGFNPLEGGFRLPSEDTFQIFDQWIEILPTDQVVAREYDTTDT